MEKVSVIIPTYNRAKTILNSVNSVLQQSYSDVEVLIVDDASVDETQAVIESVQEERVKYIKLPQNSGASVARNIGVEYAQGQIIAFEDSDDIWHYDKLEKQMKYWKEHPEYAMIYCSYNMHKKDSVYQVPERDWSGDLEGDIFASLLVRNTVGTPTMLMYKEAFQSVGGFDTTMNCLEDWDFAIKFAREYKIGYVEETLVDAFYTEGSVSSRIADGYLTRCKMIGAYREEMIAYGIFDLVVGDLFTRAQNSGILDTVKKMLMLTLAGQ